MLGCLDLELHPLSQLEFQDALLHIAEQMNTVPLGVSLDSHDPALMLVTPNKLLGKFNERRPIKPITSSPNHGNLILNFEQVPTNCDLKYPNFFVN